MSVTTVIENISSHLKNAYDELQGLGADLTNVNKNIENMSMVLDNVYDSMPQVSGEGTSLTLDDTRVGKIKSTLKGNTSQSGTPTPDAPQDIHVVNGDNGINITGKNLLPNNATTTTVNGITFTINEDKSILVNGTATSNILFDLLLSSENKTIDTGNYYLSGCPSGGAAETYRLVISVNETLYGEYGSGRALTLNKGILKSYIYITSGTTINNKIYKPQLEKGDTPTTYEPYQSQTYPINLPVENMLDISDITSGYGITNNGNGSITLQGGVTSNSFSLTTPFVLKANQTYTLSITNTNSSYSASTFILRNGSTNIVVLSYNQSSVNYTPIQNITIDTLRIFNGGNTFDNFTFYPQLEVGNKQNKWQPYGQTPIELCKIGTYQDVIKKSTGKNLFDKSTLQQGGLDLGGTGMETVNSARIRSNFIKVNPNTQYTISNIDTIVNQCGIGLYKSDNLYDTSHKINNGGWNDMPITFTTQNDTAYIRIAFRNLNSANITPTENYIIQLNEGNQALPYEPYGTGWYVKKEIGRFYSNSTTGWYYDNNHRYYRLIDNIVVPPNTDTVGQGFCNVRLVTANQTLQTSTTPGLAIHPLSRLYISESVYNNISTTPTILYYALATPIYTEITGELLNQLNALIRSYENQTNISQENNNLSFIINATALMKNSD